MICMSSCFLTLLNGGGYKVADWYHPQLHTLCAEQIKVLKKAASLVSAEDQLVIRTILEQFAP